MQSSGRGIVVDDTHWPFVRVVYTTFTAAEHEKHFSLLRAMLHEHPIEPFAVRVDLRKAQNLDAGQRRSTVEFWKNISPLIEGRFTALAYVATHPLIRGIIKAVSWFQPPPRTDAHLCQPQ